MYIIRKEFSFCASHQLEGLCEGHPCSRLHGHNYVVVVELRKETLNEVGMVRDYRELEPVKRFVDEALDHKHLNDFIDGNPTAERMAQIFFEVFSEKIPEIYAVEVSETPKTNARYEKSNS